MALFEIRHTFTLRHEFVPDAGVLALLQNIAQNLTDNRSQLQEIKEHLMTQAESFAQFKEQNDATLADLGTSLDQSAEALTRIAAAQTNIAADEQRILEKLNQMGGLTPANQAILDSAIASQQVVATKAKANADALTAAATSLQSLADSLPDEG